jgi:hypothetical protein
MHWVRSGPHHFTLSLDRVDFEELMRELDAVPTLPPKLADLKWLFQALSPESVKCP